MSFLKSFIKYYNYFRTNKILMRIQYKTLAKHHCGVFWQSYLATNMLRREVVCHRPI